MSTGWTWDYIGNNLDLPRLFSLYDYWKINPPSHLLLKAYVGYEHEEKRPMPHMPHEASQPLAQKLQGGDVANLIGALPTRVVNRNYSYG
jgi:hypothetical protein